MTKSEISRRIARESGVTPGEAADQLDRTVRQILDTLRQGKPASLPGLGLFTAGPDGRVVFQHRKNAR
jgi:nucleoid DNA-binding protein